MNSIMDRAIDQVLESAQNKKLNVEVLGFERASTAISFQKGKMEQFAVSETRQLGVRLIDGNHEGVAYTESLADDSLDQLLTEAQQNARVIQKEWIAELTPSRPMPEMKGIYNPEVDKVTVDQKIANAKALEETALAYDNRITALAYTTYGDSRMRSWIANTNGLRGSYAMNSCGGYAYCLAKDGDNVVMDGDYFIRRGYDTLNPEELAKTAARKTIARIGSVRPQTGLYTVVFDQHSASRMVGALTDYFSGKAVDEKTSPLHDKLGKKVFANGLTFIDDPFSMQAFGHRPFDDEGFPSQKTTLVENGVIKSFLTNSVLARKLKLHHTASASRAPSTDLDVSASSVIVSPGKSSLQDLLAADSKVIYITNLTGWAGFRAASGDFSIPVEGYLYENGKLSAPLKDFLISGNILDLFNAVETVGRDTESPHGNIVCPPLLVRDLNISGQA